MFLSYRLGYATMTSQMAMQIMVH